MSLSDEEKRKRARKASKTKKENEQRKEAEKSLLEKEKRTSSKLRAELKAYKALISDGWSPPGGK